DGVDLGGLVITPEVTFDLAQMVAGSVARRMVGHRRGEDDVQPGSFRAALDLLAPIGVDLAGQKDCETHDSKLLIHVDAPSGRWTFRGSRQSGWARLRRR